MPKLIVYAEYQFCICPGIVYASIDKNGLVIGKSDVDGNAKYTIVNMTNSISDINEISI